MKDFREGYTVKLVVKYRVEADSQMWSKQEDVVLLDDLHVDAYRFSISWSRIFPGTGTG